MLASVIIVSRDRDASLRLTLTSLTFQTHAPFEVIVVGDDAAERAVAASNLAERIVFVPFDQPNIAAARNAGLAAALGEVVAFIDDDAVAEPLWLESLLSPFADPRVAYAGGYVRARNGISFQWRGETVSVLGDHQPLVLPDDRISLRGWLNGTAPEAMGTNVAYRAGLLRAEGGFDPAYRYYLDESDANLRLSRSGGLAAIVPWAEVHHGLAPSAQRARERVPLRLADHGNSVAAFLERHASAELRSDALAHARAGFRARLLRHMIGGRLEPGAVGRLLRDFDAGAAAPRPPPATLSPLMPERSVQRLFRTVPRTVAPVTLAAWSWAGTRARARAVEAAAQGAVTTLFLFHPDSRFHQVRFTSEGYWLHEGGLWGRSDRNGRLVQPGRMQARVENELAARDRARPFGPVVRVDRR